MVLLAPCLNWKFQVCAQTRRRPFHRVYVNVPFSHFLTDFYIVFSNSNSSEDQAVYYCFCYILIFSVYVSFSLPPIFASVSVPVPVPLLSVCLFMSNISYWPLPQPVSYCYHTHFLPSYVICRLDAKRSYKVNSQRMDISSYIDIVPTLIFRQIQWFKQLHCSKCNSEAGLKSKLRFEEEVLVLVSLNVGYPPLMFQMCKQ